MTKSFPIRTKLSSASGGSDDNGFSGLEGSGAGGGLHFLTRLFAGQRNPPGGGNPLTFDAAPPHFSFYVNTYYIDAAPMKGSAYGSERENPVFVRRAWKEAGYGFASSAGAP